MSALRIAHGRGRRRRRALALLLAVTLTACGGHARRPSPAAGGASATAASGAAAVRVLAHRSLDDRLQEWTLRTLALRAPTGVRVLLPAVYRDQPDRRFPVLYLLHGADADYRAWTRYGDAEAITARAPLIVVMPDGGSDGWYTDWYAGARPVQPRWETYHIAQLVPWIDATYRTVAGQRARAIAGLSMGGYGALSYAARHSHTFTAVASFSGALGIGSEAAWGPEASNPRRWRAHLPVALAARLRWLSLIVLRIGDGRPGPLDPRGTPSSCDACQLERYLRRGNRRLHQRLQALHIPHVWDDYGPGTHDWPYWRRDLRQTLPDLLRHLSAH